MSCCRIVFLLTEMVLIQYVAARCIVHPCAGPSNRTAPLHFTDPNPNLSPFFLPNKLVVLDCCSNSFTNITWSYRNNVGENWIPWPWIPHCPYCTETYHQLCVEAQKFLITSVLVSDTGLYQCNVSNAATGEYITREYNLLVKLCDYTEGDIKFNKKPPSEREAEKGSSMSVICEGNFGCPSNDTSSRHAYWTFIDGNGTKHQITPANQEDLNVTYRNSVRNITVAAVLTIHNVQEIHYKLFYVCHLSNHVMTRTWNLTIHDPDVTQFSWPWICVSAAVVVVLIIAVMLFCCYKSQICYQLKRCSNRLPQLSEKEQDFYDGFVVSNSSDRAFAEENIRRPLINQGFKIYEGPEAQEGELSITDAIKKTKTVILVLSEDAVDCKYFELLYGVAVIEPGMRNVVTVEKGNIKELVKTFERKQKTLASLHKTSIVKWDDTSKMNKRKRKNFLCEIKTYLPDPRKRQKKKKLSETRKVSAGRNKSQSSTAPLLSENASSGCESSFLSSHETEDSLLCRRSLSDGEMRLSSSERQTSLTDSEPHDDHVFDDNEAIAIKPSSQSREKLRQLKKGQTRNIHLSEDSGYARSPETLYVQETQSKCFKKKGTITGM